MSGLVVDKHGVMRCRYLCVYVFHCNVCGLVVLVFVNNLFFFFQKKIYQGHSTTQDKFTEAKGFFFKKKHHF